MFSNDANGSNPKTIETCRAEIALLSKQKDKVSEQVKFLRNAEDPVNGIAHAGEIFELQQQKLQLEFQIQYLQSRIRRLIYEKD